MKPSTNNLTKKQLNSEFDRQLEILVRNKVFDLVGLDESKFLKKLKTFRAKIAKLNVSYGEGKLPFAIVFKSELLDPASVMERVVAKDKRGFVEMNPKQPKDFKSTVVLPENSIYLIINIETGNNYLNISPANCSRDIVKRKRTPLTLEEGVMVALLYPEIFTDKKNFNAIQMPGSRIANDECVPSIWFSKGAPRLGWCWDNNIHTWLGSASCAERSANSD